MLILSRRIDESIQIGDDITVTILEINGKKIRFGISAPDNVDVHREEVYERIHADQDAVENWAQTSPLCSNFVAVMSHPG